MLEDTRDVGKTSGLRQGDLEIILSHIILELRLAPNESSASDLADQFIQMIKLRTGILVEQGQGHFGFQHRTFQEYLAAVDISHRKMPEGGIAAVFAEIEPHLLDRSWHEVILLLGGNLSEFDGAPETIASLIVESGSSDPLEAVLHRRLHLAARVAQEAHIPNDATLQSIIDRLLDIAFDTRRVSRWRQPMAEIGDALVVLRGFPYNRYLVDRLLDYLNSLPPDSWQSRTALHLLGCLKCSSPEVINTVRKFVDPSIHFHTRSCAAAALVRLDVAGEKWLGEMVRMLEGRVSDGWTFSDTEEAITSAGSLNESMFHRLLAILKVPDQLRMVNHTTPRLPLTMLLAYNNGQDKYFGLINDQSADYLLRNALIRAVRWARIDDDTAVKALQGLLANEPSDGNLALQTAWALQWVGKLPSEFDEIASVQMKSNSTETIDRINYAMLLGERGFRDDVIGVGKQILHDPRVEPRDRAFAAYSLAHVLGLDSESIGIILELLANKGIEDWIRRELLSALAHDRVNLASSTDQLWSLITDDRESSSVRAMATEAIGATIGPMDNRDVESLHSIAVKDGEDEHVREAAYLALIASLS